MGPDQKRAFLAILLSGMVLFGWQQFFAPKPIKNETTSMINSSANTVTQKNLGVDAVGKQVVRDNKDHGSVNNIGFSNNTFLKKSFSINNKFSTASFTNDLIVSRLSGNQSVFKFQDVTGSNEAFQVFTIEDNRVVPLQLAVIAQDDVKVELEDKRLNVFVKLFMNDKGRLAINIQSSRPRLFRFQLNSFKKEMDNRQMREFVVHGKSPERVSVGDEESSSGSVSWFGLDFNFHLFAIVFPEKMTVRYQSLSKENENGSLIVDLVKPVTSLDSSLIFTKKSYDFLKEQGDNLHLAVDFGFFGIFAVPILRGLQFFYKYLSNYGLAIILITLIIRMATFPLQYKSFKSMKKMQKIQPQIQALKDKYKDDPQKMQKETMELFRKAGANPLSGCLPMLLQMPIFFALYSVLNNTVELLAAPFYLWINDLSVKDPFYVLPVLMGVVMFFQSKLNPTTVADPTQRKLMLFMPLIFTFMMKDLPAGLNLYMTVSILVGVIQQLVVYRSLD